jgi:hypothetical protein
VIRKQVPPVLAIVFTPDDNTIFILLKGDEHFMITA